MDELEKRWEQYFDEKARKYGNGPAALGYLSDRIYYYRKQSIISYLSDLFSPLRHKVILDAGCGNGLITKELAQHNTVFGLDISRKMCCLANSNGLLAAQGSVRSLPFRDETFDIVICAGVIQSVEPLLPMIAECLRVTKHGGLLLIEALNAESLIRRAYHMLKRPSLKITAYRIDNILSLMKSIGLSRFAVIYLYYPLTYSKWRRSVRCNALDKLLSTAYVIAANRE